MSLSHRLNLFIRNFLQRLRISPPKFLFPTTTRKPTTSTTTTTTSNILDKLHKQQRHVPLIRSAASIGYIPYYGPSMPFPNPMPDSILQQIPGLGDVMPNVPQPQQQQKKRTPSSPKVKKGRKSKHATAATNRQRLAPSKASGGVPDPTQHYITQAFLEPVSLPEPRRMLLVIDLNGTLLFRPNKKRPFHFVERPHASQFLAYCLDTFYVAIWSSARPENVDRMVAQLLTPEQRERCLLIWARDRFDLSPTDYNSRIQVYKRLTTVWAEPKVMNAHPDAAVGGRWDQTNTILLDDSLEKARTEPFNLLQIPEFAGLATEYPNVLPQVHDYLNSLSWQSDVSRSIRQRPFRLDPNYRLEP